MEWYYVCWPWLNSKRVARVCRHKLSFLFLKCSSERLSFRSAVLEFKVLLYGSHSVIPNDALVSAIREGMEIDWLTDWLISAHVAQQMIRRPRLNTERSICSSPYRELHGVGGRRRSRGFHNPAGVETDVEGLLRGCKWNAGLKTHFTLILPLPCLQWQKERICQKLLWNPIPTTMQKYQLRHSGVINDAYSSDVNKTKFLRPRPRPKWQDQDHRK